MGWWRNVWPARENLAPHLGAVRSLEDLRYGSAHPKQALDLYLPREGATGPVALVLHGGGPWRTQDRKLLRGLTGLFSNVGVALARRGIAAAVASYRQGDGEIALADVRAALEWIAREGPAHGLDRSRALVIGHSAGAHLAAMLAVEGPALRGVVAIGGFYDVARFSATLTGRQRRALARMCGAALARWSPERGLSPSTPPLLVLAGEREPASLVTEQRRFLEAARLADARASGWTVPRAGHMGVVLDIGMDGDATTDRLAAFAREVS